MKFDVLVREAEVAERTLLSNFLPLLRECLPEVAIDVEESIASLHVSNEPGMGGSLSTNTMAMQAENWSSMKLGSHWLYFLVTVFGIGLSRTRSWVLFYLMLRGMSTLSECFGLCFINAELPCSSQFPLRHNIGCRGLCLWCIRNGGGQQWAGRNRGRVLPNVSVNSKWVGRKFLVLSTLLLIGVRVSKEQKQQDKTPYDVRVSFNFQLHSVDRTRFNVDCLVWKVGT